MRSHALIWEETEPGLWRAESSRHGDGGACVYEVRRPRGITVWFQLDGSRELVPQASRHDALEDAKAEAQNIEDSIELGAGGGT